MELISREEAIRCVKENSYCLGGDLIEINGYCAVKDIEELPAIESRPKGKWIKGDMFECDQCHHRMIVGDGAYNYCPNCGADMRGEE